MTRTSTEQEYAPMTEPHVHTGIEMPVYKTAMVTRALGRNVLSLSDRKAMFGIAEDMLSDPEAELNPTLEDNKEQVQATLDNTYYSGKADEMLRQDIDAVRTQLLKFDDARGEVLDKYFDDNATEFFKNLKTTATDTEEPVSWGEWLGAGATDEQLINFLQWHYHEVEK